MLDCLGRGYDASGRQEKQPGSGNDVFDETYDVIVEPKDDRAYTVFAQSIDRSGYARGTLTPHPGMVAEIPPLDPRPLLTMGDMGMAHDMSSMSGSHASGSVPSGTANPHAGGNKPPTDK